MTVLCATCVYTNLTARSRAQQPVQEPMPGIIDDHFDYFLADKAGSRPANRLPLSASKSKVCTYGAGLWS